MADSSNYAIFEGWKRYELTNHLGNVLAVVSDRKIGKSTGSYPGPALWYEADVLSTQQYYPFGMLMPGRQYAVGSYDYRYGFNGKEGDDEVKGDDNQQDYGMRIYDPRVGRFLSVDPITKQYPELTPYQFASNTPIQAIDLDGLERAIVINRYSNGNIQRTQIQQINSAQNLSLNFNATGNGIGPLTMNDILDINVGQLPADNSVPPFLVRTGVNGQPAQFNPSEQTILNAGIDMSRTLNNRGSSGPDNLASVGGFSFPGASPTLGQQNIFQSSDGTWSQIPVFQTQTNTKTTVQNVQFPSTTIASPIAISPLDGSIAPDPTNSSGFNQLKNVFSLASQNNIPNVNVNIGLVGNLAQNKNTLQGQISRTMGATFNYSGRVNVNIVPAPENQGFINISSPGNTIRRTTTKRETKQVQTGTTNQLNPN